MTLREVLHAHIPTLTDTSTVRDAVDKMDIYQFPALVIVDGDNRPTAVITEGDIVRAVSLGENLAGLAEEPAHMLGTPQPTCLSADTEISEAFHRMRMSGLTLLPVIDEDRLSGVVLRVDLMQAMLTDLAEKL